MEGRRPIPDQLASPALSVITFKVESNVRKIGRECRGSETIYDCMTELRHRSNWCDTHTILSAELGITGPCFSLV